MKVISAAIFGLILAMGGLSVSAADFDGGLSVGRNSAVHADVQRATVGTTLIPGLGLKLNGEYEYSRNAYTAYGAFLSKDISVTKDLSVGAKIGADWFDSNSPALANGWAGRYGLQAGYKLTKDISLVADYTRTFNLQDAHQYKGNTITAGVKFAF